jgi:hypothetical protein
MDRLLRAQGNGSGRARLGQASYYPRGLVVSTGEAVPSGKSLVARMVVLRMGDALDWERLTVLQRGLAFLKKTPTLLTSFKKNSFWALRTGQH